MHWDLLSRLAGPLLWPEGKATKPVSWWRHQMETFSALLAICAGNSPVPGESPAQRPVTQSFDVFFDLRLNKRLRKQSRGWWFETLSRPLWRHRNDIYGQMALNWHLNYENRHTCLRDIIFGPLGAHWGSLLWSKRTQASARLWRTGFHVTFWSRNSAP